MLQTYNFRVEMTCGGCAGHVRQILQGQLEKGAVMSFTVDQVEKLVRITTHLNLDDIQTELRKCGKPVTFLSSVNASIFNPGAFKFPLPPAKTEKEDSRGRGQACPITNTDQMPAKVCERDNFIYSAPPAQTPVAPNWKPVQGQSQGQSQGEAQGQASPGPLVVRATNNTVKPRLSGLSPAPATPATDPRATPIARNVHQSLLLNGPPPPEPIFKSFPRDDGSKPPGSSVKRAAQSKGKVTEKVASASLSGRKRSSRQPNKGTRNNNKQGRGSASVVVLTSQPQTKAPEPGSGNKRTVSNTEILKKLKKINLILDTFTILKNL